MTSSQSDSPKPDTGPGSAKADEAKPGPESKPDTKSDSGTDLAKTDEIGGPKGPEPTRYGDWEKKGRCSDF